LESTPASRRGVEALPDDVPPAVRLRRLLKYAGRDCALWCVSALAKSLAAETELAGLRPN
jgi:hypothetical protein